MKKGFTLIEIVVYIGLLGIVFGAIIFLMMWTLRSQAKTKAEREVVFEASRAIEIMAKEIKLAKNIYTPSSVFNTSPGQLSLETANVLPLGETTTYADFFVCGKQICLKRESQNPVSITSDLVQADTLIFKLINELSGPSVQISLTMSYHTPSSKMEYRASTSLTQTVSLRYEQ